MGALGAGVVALGIGTGFLVAASVKEDQAGGVTDLAEYNRIWEAAESRRTVGVVSVSVGAALTAAGVVRLAISHRAASQRGASTLTVTIGPEAVVVGGRF
jgi:hypothetical protein